MDLESGVSSDVALIPSAGTSRDLAYSNQNIYAFSGWSGRINKISTTTDDTSLLTTIDSSSSGHGSVAYGGGSLFAVGAGYGDVYVIDSLSGESTFLTNIKTGGNSFDLSWGDGVLYSINSWSGQVNAIDPLSGAQTLVATVEREGGFSHASLAYGAGSLYAVSGEGKLHKIDPITGATQLLTNIRTGGVQFDLAFGSDRLYSIESWSGRILDIDPNSGDTSILTTVDNTCSAYCNSALAFAPVPVPPAFWLFSSALGLLGWTRTRAK